MTYKNLTKALLTTCLTSVMLGCAPVPMPKQADNVDAKAEPAVQKTADSLPNYLNRPIEDEVFYFVLPDRFHNGDTDNDNGSKTIAISQGGFNPEHKGAYHGGDIPGLTEKLPYLKDMGVTAIWLTPILRNQATQGDISGYHGYWVLDFTEIDPHLGTNEDLKTFIDAAHEQNMKVFFDIITNHTADVIKYTECHGEDGSGWSEQGELCPYKTLEQLAAGESYTTIVPDHSKGIKVPQWLNDPKYYHNQGDSTFQGENSIYGDFFGLDDINTDDPEVVAGMIDIFQDIITKFKPDGFRIDTVKHVNIEFWQSFIPALRAHAIERGIPQFFMFGEVYSADSDVLSTFTTQGKMDSVLDFGFQDAVRKVLIEKAGTDNLTTLFNNDVKYEDNDSRASQLLNFVGNHDMGRFAWMLKQSGVDLASQQATDRITLAHAMMYFLRGIPVVYYGAEQGFVGDGGNHDSRQDMMPSKVASFNDDVLVANASSTADDNFDKNSTLYKSFAEFADVYLSHAALRQGQQQVQFSSDESGIFAVTRQGKNEQYLVVFNTADTDKNYRVSGEWQNAKRVYTNKPLSGDAKTLSSELIQPALSVSIWKQ